MGVPTPFLAVIGASAGYGQVYRTQKHRKPLAGTPSHARRARYQAVAPNRSDLGLRPAPPRRPTCGKRRLRALAVGATRPARLPSSVVLTRNARRLTYYEDRAACCLLINSHTLRRFARRGARACGRPFCARPSGSSCSGRGGGVQAAGSQASSSWRRRASLGATPAARSARTRSSARSREFSAATSRLVEPRLPALRLRPRALHARVMFMSCACVSAARGPVVYGLLLTFHKATATADATS